MVRVIAAIWLIGVLLASGPVAAQPGRLRPVDDARAAAAGLRKIEGKHLVLYTDLPPSESIDSLPAIFDAAVPQWAAYFAIPLEQVSNWQARGYLIGDRTPFDALGLMSEENDQFPHGLSIGAELWFYEQPTEYYRRHLMLHEGTHAFMATTLGSSGPGWFMEGMAELMATHTWDPAAGQLVLRAMPAERDDMPMLGRIRLVRDALSEDRALSLLMVMQIDNRRFLNVESYAWCWAAVKFLDAHPRYGERFRQIRDHVAERDFNRIFRKEVFGDDWDDLCTEWTAYIAALEHGYDYRRMAIEFQPGKPLANGSQEIEIVADRGWQSSGVRVEAGQSYRVTAAGRYQIAEDGGVWWCEPGGVTIEYFRGRPLGELLASIDARPAEREFTPSVPIGLGTVLTPEVSGTLYLRVNDSAARLDDNGGTLTVEIERVE